MLLAAPVVAVAFEGQAEFGGDHRGGGRRIRGWESAIKCGALAMSAGCSAIAGIGLGAAAHGCRSVSTRTRSKSIPGCSHAVPHGVTDLEETSDARTLIRAVSRRSPVNASSRQASLEARLMRWIDLPDRTAFLRMRQAMTAAYSVHEQSGDDHGTVAVDRCAVCPGGLQLGAAIPHRLGADGCERRWQVSRLARDLPEYGGQLWFKLSRMFGPQGHGFESSPRARVIHSHIAFWVLSGRGGVTATFQTRHFSDR